ncbi:hypothetical protein ABPG74_019649 [Tetrahymena malaccensis]
MIEYSQNLQDSSTQNANQFGLGLDNSPIQRIQNQRQRKYTNQSEFKVSAQMSQDSPFNRNMAAKLKYDKNDGQMKNQIDQDKWKKLEKIMKKLKFKTFIKKFIMLSRKKLYKLLNATQLSLINDQASHFDFEKQNRMQQKTIEVNQSYFYLDQTNKKEFALWMIFNPNNLYLEIWNFIKLFCTINCFFFYLVSFSFNMHLKDILNPIIYFGCQFCFAFDILIRLNTAIYVKGQLTLSRNLIIKQYKSSNLLYYDILQVLSFFLYQFLVALDFIPIICQQIFLLPIVFKYQDLNNMLQKMKNKFISNKQAQKVFELINLIKNILFISHIFSCIWILAAKVYLPLIQQQPLNSNTQLNQQNFTTWIDFMNIQNENWAVQYLYSYYFIIVTMITVGYGDVKPTNPLEVGVCIILMMTCCLVFGFTINQIGYIFQDLYLKEKNILLKRNIISNYMQKREINSQTQKQILEYLEYIWREDLDEHQQEANAILNQLSSNLKQQIQLESNKLVLKENRILKDNFSPQILTEIIPYIQEQNCTPGEVIIDDQIGNIEGYLYFVQQGEVEQYKETQMYLQNQKKSIIFIKKIVQGENFGQEAFFTGQKQSLSVRSLNFSTLLKIKRNDFLMIIKQFQSDFEKFCMIKDKILYSGFYVQLNEQCSSCNERNHTEIQCPILHYIPKKFKVLQENSINTPHLIRQTQFQRRVIQKRNTFQELENNVYRGLQFIEDKGQDLDEFENQFLEFSFFQRNELNYSDQEQNQEKVLIYSQKVKQMYQKNQTKKLESDKYQKKKSRICSFVSSHLIKQKSFDEENIQQSAKSIQNKSESEIDLEQENYRKKMHKKFMNTVSVIYQSSKLIQEQEELSETNHYSKQNIGQVQRHSSILNHSLKDLQIQEKYAKNQKANELSNSFKTQIESHIQMNLQPYSNYNIIDTQFNIGFDMFFGRFESLQNYKYYFPQQNCKEVLNKLNEILINQVNSRGINIKNFLRNDNSNFKRRNNLYNIVKKKMNDPLFKQTIDSQNQTINANNINLDGLQDITVLDSFANQKSFIVEPQNKIVISNISQQQNFKNQNVTASIDTSIIDLNNVNKLNLDIPEFEDEQDNLRALPLNFNPKRTYLFDSNN